MTAEPEPTVERLTRLLLECYRVVGRAALAAELTEVANSGEAKRAFASTVFIEMCRRAQEERRQARFQIEGEGRQEKGSSSPTREPKPLSRQAMALADLLATHLDDDDFAHLHQVAKDARFRGKLRDVPGAGGPKLVATMLAYLKSRGGPA